MNEWRFGLIEQRKNILGKNVNHMNGHEKLYVVLSLIVLLPSAIMEMNGRFVLAEGDILAVL